MKNFSFFFIPAVAEHPKYTEGFFSSLHLYLILLFPNFEVFPELFFEYYSFMFCCAGNYFPLTFVSYPTFH